jgi:hypothetical protein
MIPASFHSSHAEPYTRYWKANGRDNLIHSFIILILLFASAHLQAQIQFEQVPPPLPAPQNIAELQAVSSGACLFSDIDNDGDLDLLLTGLDVFAGQYVSNLYINDGQGNFSLAVNNPFDVLFGASSSSMAFADVNGNGYDDLLITGLNTEGEHQAYLYFNNGDGNFSKGLDTSFEGVWLSSVAFADVDGDGDQDLFISGENIDGIPISNLYKNDGNGIFTKEIGTLFSGVASGSIAFADVDGDSDFDLLITGSSNYSDPPIAELYINDGNGNFALSADTAFLGVTYSDLAFADVDGDGDQDVFIAGNLAIGQSANLYVNDGSGSFTLAVEVPFIGTINGTVDFADVDGDGDMDLLVTGETNTPIPRCDLYLNDGYGMFTLLDNTPFPGVYFSCTSFADIDGDEDMDVLISGLLFVNDGNGVFTEVTASPFDNLSGGSIAFADVDGDGDQDALITGRNVRDEIIAKMYTNDGNGSYSQVTGTPFPGVEFGAIAFGDVDGDGDVDVLLTGADSSLEEIARLFTNDGNGHYTQVNGTTIEGIFSAFADVDGDGDLDLLTTGSYSSNTWNGLLDYKTKLYTNDGSGIFTEVLGTLFLGVYSRSFAFADVDGDNDLDLLITGYDNNTFQELAILYLNDGSGNYSEVTETPFEGLEAGHISFGDVDNDNDMDVIFTGYNADYQVENVLYTNDGIGNFTEVPGTPFEGVAHGSVVFADLDTDGDLDVMFSGLSNSSNGSAKVYVNNGNLDFTEIDDLPFVGAFESSINIVDIDGDGDDDVSINGLFKSGLYRNITNLPCTITAICSPLTISLPSEGFVSILPSDVDAGSVVGCGEAILSLSKSEFDSSNLGENMLTLTVSDENGNSETCKTTVTVLGPPDPCRYFLSNHNTQGGSDVYELTINEIANTADMNLLVSVPQKVTLSYSLPANLLYLGRENNSTFQTYNPDGGSLGLPIGVNVGLSGFAGATYGPDGMLYAASQTSGAVYRFNPTNFTGSLYSAAQVNGGDIDFTADGELILVSRSPARAFLVNENGPNTILGPVPAGVSGLARRADGTFLVSVQGLNQLIVGSTTEGDLGLRFDLKLNGAPFTPANGDLASGCPVPAAAMIVLTDANLPVNALEVGAKLASQPNPTEGSSVVTFTTETGTRATLEVYDVSGRSVATLFNAEVQPGQEYRAAFNGAALPNGVYIYRLTTDAEVVIEKFMIAR